MKIYLCLLFFSFAFSTIGQSISASYAYQILTHEEYTAFSGGQISYELLNKYSTIGISGLFLGSEKDDIRNVSRAKQYGVNVNYALAFINNENFNLSFGSLIGV